MNAEDLFVFSEEPAAPEPIELKYPKPGPCPFCGVAGHVQTMNIWVRGTDYFITGCNQRERKKAYVFCGKCKARGPIVVKTLEYPGSTYRDVQEMEIEAIRLWNRRAE